MTTGQVGLLIADIQIIVGSYIVIGPVFAGTIAIGLGLLTYACLFIVKR